MMDISKQGINCSIFFTHEEYFTLSGIPLNDHTDIMTLI